MYNRSGDGAIERLFRQRRVVASTGCWEWTGGREKRGDKRRYGIIPIWGSAYRVHRVAAFVWLGVPLESTLYILHHCDNVICFNPEHLYAGTQGDNMRDMRERGRYPRGSALKNAKLTEEAVVLIRKRAASGESMRSIARSAGVGAQTVRFAVKGITWNHVPAP